MRKVVYILFCSIWVLGCSQKTDNDLTKLHIKGKVKTISLFSYYSNQSKNDTIKDYSCGNLEYIFDNTDICKQLINYNSKGNIKNIIRLESENMEQNEIYHYDNTDKLIKIETFINNGLFSEEVDRSPVSNQPKILVKLYTVQYDKNNNKIKDELRHIIENKIVYSTTYEPQNNNKYSKETTVSNDFLLNETDITVTKKIYDEKNRIIEQEWGLDTNPNKYKIKYLYNKDTNQIIGQEQYENSRLTDQVRKKFDGNNNIIEVNITSFDTLIGKAERNLFIKYKYDKKDNWIQRETKYENRSIITERKIEYY